MGKLNILNATKVQAEYLTVNEDLEIRKLTLLKKLDEVGTKLNFLIKNNKSEKILEKRDTKISLYKELYINDEFVSCPIGIVMPYVLEDEIPKGWLLCNDQKINRNEYPKLFDCIGDSTPNLVNKFIVGSNTVSLKEDKKLDDYFNLSWDNVKSFKANYNYKDLSIGEQFAGDSKDEVYYLNGDNNLSYRNLSFTIGNNNPLEYRELLPLHCKIRFIIKAK